MGLLQSLSAEHRDSAESWKLKVALISPYSSEGQCALHTKELPASEHRKTRTPHTRVGLWENVTQLGQGLWWAESLLNQYFFQHVSNPLLTHSWPLPLPITSVRGSSCGGISWELFLSQDMSQITIYQSEFEPHRMSHSTQTTWI